MVFFGRLAFGIKIQELGTVQPYALSSSFQNLLCLIRKFNIAQQCYFRTIACYGRHIFYRIKSMLKLCKFFGILLILLDSLVIRIYNNNAPITVDNNCIASADIFGKVFQGHHSRNTQRSCNNSSMTCAPTGIAGNSFNEFLVKPRRLGRAQFASNNRNLFGQMLDVLTLLTKKLFEQTSFDIVNVRRTFADISIFYLGEMRRNLTKGGRYGVLSRYRFGMYQIRYPLSQASIVQESQMHSENIFYLAPLGLVLCRLKLG